MDVRALTGAIRPRVKIIRAAFIAICVGVALWLTSRYDYLLFHSISEMFSIAVACAVFMYSWNSRMRPEARPFVLLGVGYLFVAILDMVHTLTYLGMNVLPQGQDYATKLWMAARGLQAATTLAFVILARVKRTAPDWVGVAVVGAATVFLFLSIFTWKIFPLCFVEGQGVTVFKKAGEYVISAILAASIIILAGDRRTLAAPERGLLMAAFGLNIVSELVFTLYVSAYGYQNFIGHLLKIGSFYLVYHALFASEVRKHIALIGELERSKARLEKSESELLTANLTKDKFFSILGHDLRNPISGVLATSELLATRFDDLDPKKIRNLAVLLHEGARRGAELLEAILQWAKAQAGRLEVQPSSIRLSELCEGIADQHRPLARGKDISILSRVEADAVAYADENMLATVLRNLVSNAVKFTPHGGQVVLSAEAKDAWEMLSVADTGVGMRPEDMKKLFRIDVHFSCPGTDAERGNGMGLILCKELVQLNKGLISVQTEPGKGSTFTVRLPRFSHSPTSASSP